MSANTAATQDSSAPARELPVRVLKAPPLCAVPAAAATPTAPKPPVLFPGTLEAEALEDAEAVLDVDVDELLDAGEVDELLDDADVATTAGVAPDPEIVPGSIARALTV